MVDIKTLRVGDEVQIIANPPSGIDRTEGPKWVDSMDKLAGKVGKVSYIGEHNPWITVTVYGERDPSYQYLSTWLEPVEPKPAAIDPASQARKDTPIYSGCLAYFPDALAAVARLSKRGNDKHNPGQPLHWSKGKSGDHADALTRHLMQHGEWDEDNQCSHTVAVAWRALALLQSEIDAKRIKARD